MSPEKVRPYQYPTHVVQLQGHHREQRHVDESVGAWKAALKNKGTYLPIMEVEQESYLRQLASALKNHASNWKDRRPCEGIHEDRHQMFKFLQWTFFIPTQYENPDLWYEHQRRNSNHCLEHRCVSVWWYYDQAMRDIPGFDDSTKHKRRKVKHSTNQPINHSTSHIASSDGVSLNQPNPLTSSGTSSRNYQQPRYTGIQESVADAAAKQRQLALHHHAPEPHEDMEDLEDYDIHFDEHMLPEVKRELKSLENEIRLIKMRHPSKTYMAKRTRIIQDAEEARLQNNTSKIPHFLFTVKTPWASGCGQADNAYDEDKIFDYKERIAQLRSNNAHECQMEISSSEHGPAGRRNH
jgi:hypothetical protein